MVSDSLVIWLVVLFLILFSISSGFIFRPDILPIPKDSGPYRVYYIRAIWLEKYVYKIGRTERTLEKRFSGHRGQYREIKSFYFDSFKDSKEHEKLLHRKHHKDRLASCFALGDGGHTEWFGRDVLVLDKDSPEYKMKQKRLRYKRQSDTKYRKEIGDRLWWLPYKIRKILPIGKPRRSTSGHAVAKSLENRKVRINPDSSDRKRNSTKRFDSRNTAGVENSLSTKVCTWKVTRYSSAFYSTSCGQIYKGKPSDGNCRKCGNTVIVTS